MGGRPMTPPRNKKKKDGKKERKMNGIRKILKGRLIIEWVLYSGTFSLFDPMHWQLMAFRRPRRLQY